MDNVTLFESLQFDGSTKTYVIIDRGNDEYTSMLKSEYDRIQAETVNTPVN